MLQKLAEIKKKYEELERKLADPASLCDREGYRGLTRAHAGLIEIVTQLRVPQSVRWPT